MGVHVGVGGAAAPGRLEGDADAAAGASWAKGGRWFDEPMVVPVQLFGPDDEMFATTATLSN